MLNRLFQIEQDANREEHDHEHNHYVGDLREVPKYKGGYEVSEYLRSHVEGLEESEIKSFRLCRGAVCNVVP